MDENSMSESGLQSVAIKLKALLPESYHALIDRVISEAMLELTKFIQGEELSRGLEYLFETGDIPNPEWEGNRAVITMLDSRFVLAREFPPVAILGLCPNCGMEVPSKTIRDRRTLADLLVDFKPNNKHDCHAGDR
jgi:hypothetical protein